MSTPVFINCRDRLSPLKELVDWLERAQCEEIYFIDNDSRYEPLLEYYEESPHTTIRLDRNYGKHALWEAPGVFDRTAGRRYVYTDPDVVPAPHCPVDALERFAYLLDRYPRVMKVGFGLRVDDIPDHYAHKDTVIGWERNYWRWPVERGAYYAPIDTTFALYRPVAAPTRVAIRTGPPYVARHDSWYLDFEHLSDEDRFYDARAENSTPGSDGMAHWTGAVLPDDVRAMFERSTASQQGALSRLSHGLWWRIHGRRTLRK